MALTGEDIAAMLRAAGAGTTGKVMPLDDIATAFSDAMLHHGSGQFGTVDQVAALLSSCMMESAWFSTTEEFTKDGRYAPYIGRTFMQVTWRDNYAAFGAWCHTLGLVADPDVFVKEPARLADLEWAALGGVWYFTQVMFDGKPLTAYASDILAVGRAVNLGNPHSTFTPNGQRAREAAYTAVRSLGPTIIPSAPTPPVVPPPPVIPPPVEEPPMSPTERIPFRGGLTCACVVESLPWVELDMILQGVIRESIDVFQWGYSGGVAASAGTHDGGGCTDVAQRSPAAIRIWRKWGWTQQERINVGTGPHAHGWPYRCPHLSAGARSQEADWDRGDSGLQGSASILGPYPIRPWKTALKENKMAVLDEVEKAVVNALKRSDSILQKAVIDALRADGTVSQTESNLTGNEKNPRIAATSALDYLGRRVMEIRAHTVKAATVADLRRVEAKLDALAKAVAALK